MKSTFLSDEKFYSVLSDESKNVLLHHLESFGRNDLQQLMSDYTEDAVLVTQEQTYQGVRDITSFFMVLMEHFKNDQSNFVLDQLVVKDELVFIVWHAKTPSLEVVMGTDTFLIKDGKIAQQTFAGQLIYLRPVEKN